MEVINKKKKHGTTGELGISTSVISNWAWLPSELLDVILEKLIPISKDYVRFGAVCKPWQSVALHQKEQRIKSYHKHLAMYTVIMPGHEISSAALYSFTQGITMSCELKLNLTAAMNYFRSCSSSHGWLAYPDDSRGVVTLLNPVTGRTIRLPPVIDIRTHTVAAYFRWDIKVVLSADPSSSPNDYEALIVLYYQSLDLKTITAHFKAADDAWTIIDIDDNDITDAIYYKGQFLAFTRAGGIFPVNVSSESTITKPYLDIKFVARPLHVPKCYATTHFLASSGGDILLVKKFRPYSAPFDRIFKVFKLSRACRRGDTLKWVEIESIGDDALFLNYSESRCFSASDFPECQPNSIYFINEKANVGVFNLESGRRIEIPYHCANPSEDHIAEETFILLLFPTIV